MTNAIELHQIKAYADHNGALAEIISKFQIYMICLYRPCYNGAANGHQAI